MLTLDAARALDKRSRRLLLALLILVSLSLLGSVCVQPGGSPDPGADPDAPPVAPPILGLTLNGIPEDTNQILAVPPSGFVINIDWEETEFAVDLDTLAVTVAGWDNTFRILTSKFTVDADGAWVVVSDQRALPEGSHTLYATIRDVEGSAAQAEYSFAVRDFALGQPPIGEGQEIWFDFESDRDATPGPDFDVDLEVLGLASPAAPAWMNEAVRDWIVAETLERVRVAFEDSNPARLPGPDAIAVHVSDRDLGLSDTTRICVGGEDPTGGITLGNVLLDPKNAQRATIECGTIPPTGVFPREILMYSGQAEFRATIDPLRPAVGGTPVGAHSGDALVLDPSFDPSQPGVPFTDLSRYIQVRNAVNAFAAALGTVLAHEAGHALGLVPEGPPGIGLYGGDATSPSYAHNEMPDGTAPRKTWLMNPGGLFSFAELAALSGHSPAEFRPLNHAYLRDRVVLTPEVTSLLPPPTLESVDPVVVSASYETIHLYGAGFSPTPSVTLSNAGFIYEAIGETFVTDTEITAAIVRGQVVPGVYDVTLMNPDGQLSYVLGTLTVE